MAMTETQRKTYDTWADLAVQDATDWGLADAKHTLGMILVNHEKGQFRPESGESIFAIAGYIAGIRSMEAK